MIIDKSEYEVMGKKCPPGYHWVKGYNKVTYEGTYRGNSVLTHVRGHCAKNPMHH